MSKKIRLKRAALLGAIICPILLVARLAITGDGPREGASGYLGYALGGIVGGALLFVAVAAVLNLLKR